jgi:hypothetical protein
MCFSYVFDELCCFYAAAMLLVLLCLLCSANANEEFKKKFPGKGKILSTELLRFFVSCLELHKPIN